MMDSNYSYLMGMSKKEVIGKLGDEFNFYPDDQWIYLLSKNILGRKTFLIIIFKEDHVIKIKIHKTYGKSNKT